MHFIHKTIWIFSFRASKTYLDFLIRRVHTYYFCYFVIIGQFANNNQSNTILSYIFCFFAGNVLSAGPKKRRPYLLKRRANTTGNLKDKDENGMI